MKLNKIRRGDLMLLMHCLPIRYSGISCIAEATDIRIDIPAQRFELCIRFIRFLNKTVSAKQLYQLDSKIKTTSKIVMIQETVLMQIMKLENQ